MGGGGGGGGGRNPLEEWFWDTPICTRWWTTATIAVSALVQCQMITPYQLFYSFRAVFIKNQVCYSPTAIPSTMIKSRSSNSFLA